MTLRRFFITLAIAVAAHMLLAVPAAAQTAPDTCWVEGYLFGNDMKLARAGVVVIKRIEKPGYLFTWRPSAEAKADSNGFVRIPLPRGSTAYLYSQHLYSISRDQTNGTPIPIPNTPTARLENLPPATSVPSTYMVAVPQQRYTVKQDGVTKADTIHTLDVSGAIVTSPSPGTAHLQITGGSVVAYGDSIHVADSLARMRRVFISRLSAAITLDSSTDAAGRIYYTVSLDPDTVQAWLRDSSMTWILGRVVQLADSGIAERGYMTPTQIRTLLAGYSVTGHAHAIADVTGLATALGDTVSYRDRMTKVEGSLAVILDTIAAVKGRLATVVTDLNAHIGAADAHLPSQTGQTGKVLATNGTVSAWQPEADPVYAAAAPTLRSKGDTLVDVRQTHLEMPNLTHILTADSNKTICVDGSGRLYLCWKGSGGAAVTFDTLRFVSKNRADTLRGAKRFESPMFLYGTSSSDLLLGWGATTNPNHNNYLKANGASTLLVSSNSYPALLLSEAQWTLAVNTSSPDSTFTTSGTPGHAVTNKSGGGSFRGGLRVDQSLNVANGVRAGKRVTAPGISGDTITAPIITAPSGIVSAKTVVGDSVLVGRSGLRFDTTARADSMFIQQIEHYSAVALDRDYAAQTPPRKIGTVKYRFVMGSGGIYEGTIVTDSANGVRLQGFRFEGASYGYGQFLQCRFVTTIGENTTSRWKDLISDGFGQNYKLAGTAYIYPGDAFTGNVCKADLRVWIAAGRAVGELIVDYIIIGNGTSLNPVRVLNF